ncbi:GH23456 [Drosophila grimshawi]|uniref:GH23456 n=1 Tax=Drosophila grimshawi TaxID=7222 RepID=B4K097_DROGR|nr:GH23456 [Drosophila grimshawi]
MVRRTTPPHRFVGVDRPNRTRRDRGVGRRDGRPGTLDEEEPMLISSEDEEDTGEERRSSTSPVNPDDEETMPWPPDTPEPEVIVISDEEEEEEQREVGGEAQGEGMQILRPGGTLRNGVYESYAGILLAMWTYRSSYVSMLSVGKRTPASATEGRAGAEQISPKTLIGSLQDEGAQLTAIVEIGNCRYKATIDTGATSSFVSEKLAHGLINVGRRSATAHRVRLADGRNSGVREQVEVNIRLGLRNMDIALLILPGVIDDLVLRWDFLSGMGTVLEGAGLLVGIPKCETNQQEEMLSVAKTVETPIHPDAEIDQFLRGELAAFGEIKGT